MSREMMPSGLVSRELENFVLSIRLHRDGKKNALTRVMYEELQQIFAEADTDNQVRVILFLGGDGCFTAGNDLADFLNHPTLESDSPVIRFLATMATARKPIVAAVAGPAVGIGTTMLLHCELVYCADNARLEMPFINLGLCPEFASSLLLPRQLGYVRAAELLLLAEPFDAQTAKEYGLVNEVLPVDACVERAQQAAARLASKPPASLRIAKQLMKQSMEPAVLEQIRLEAEQFSALLQGPEAREALQAFMEKRAPDFSRF